MFLVTNFEFVVIRVCVCVCVCFFLLLLYQLYGVAQLVEALRYKPKGRGFDSRWAVEIFH
jgi:hypothetical protein